jgi:hypothetical protein
MFFPGLNITFYILYPFEGDTTLEPFPVLVDHGTEDRALAEWVVSHDKIGWIVLGFNAYKSFAMDGIFLALRPGDHNQPKDEDCKACTALRYIPLLWKMVSYIFTPKPW